MAVFLVVSTNCESHTAKILAAEDVRCGDFVGILREVVEYPPFFWDCAGEASVPREPVRVPVRAADGGVPLKVKAICLPFLLVKTPQGQHRTLDVRQCELVRLGSDYAALAWKTLGEQPPTPSRTGPW